MVITLEYNLLESQQQTARVLLLSVINVKFLLLINKKGKTGAHEFQKMGDDVWLFPIDDELHQSYK